MRGLGAFIKTTLLNTYLNEIKGKDDVPPL